MILTEKERFCCWGVFCSGSGRRLTSERAAVAVRRRRRGRSRAARVQVTSSILIDKVELNKRSVLLLLP